MSGLYTSTIGFGDLEKLHRNITTYTRSVQAQAPSVAKGEVAIGVAFAYNFEKWSTRSTP